MNTIIVKKVINVPIQQAWSVIRNLEGLENYLPAVKNTELTQYGAITVRKVFLHNGSSFEETILHIDDKRSALYYAMQDPSPFPYSNYSGMVKLIPVSATSCEVSWSAVCKPENVTSAEADQYLSSIMHSGIDGVEQYAQSLNPPSVAAIGK